MDNVPQQTSLEGIAIVGMSGRFPGADNVQQFWDNLVAGRESLTRFSRQDALRAGATQEQADAIESQARGVIQNPDHFDADLFGMNPREAEIMDPQQRLLLEVAWEAFEHAGYDHDRPPGPIGVFVGSGINTYQMSNLATRPDVTDQYGMLPTILLNEKDFLATRLAYRLNLRGPAVNVQTACSTSLVAVCNACQSLLNFECDMALAGAAHVAFPQHQSRVHAEGGMVSQDGHCRPFDHRASGTVFSDGVGAVVLRRLEDAVADGDNVIAVIRGYGLNNDGSDKAGFTAPSVNGQAEAIQIAHALGETDPESISYIEAHGTGTRLGDPIELAGLVKAFEAGTDRKQFCGIGSVKSNIGHLDVAAGVAGLIKTALALQHRQIPPTINYEAPNQEIDFAASPFHVVDQLTDWQVSKGPLRAGISSFGIGGTNAHVVLEESPRQMVENEDRQPKQQKIPSLIPVSAHTPEALKQATDNLAAHLSRHPDIALQDVAFTFQNGRHPFAHRRTVVSHDLDDAIRQLQSGGKSTESGTGTENRSVVSHRRSKPVFMFPGQGSQRINMGRQLYQTESVYRTQVDRCAELLMDDLGLDIREAIFPETSSDAEAADRLSQTSITQPALFVTEYALAQLWISWGVRPHAMIGHSVGEYTAACLANVFSLPKALHLIAARGRLIQGQPRGAMLAIMKPEAECQQFVSERVSIAAVNSPELCVVSGEASDIDGLVSELERGSIACRPLVTSHAFHSAMMEPVIEPFADILSEAELKPPVIPFVSNVSGDWITDEQAVSPDYWTAHLRQGVMFQRGIGTILQMKDVALMEVGPGHTLTVLARQHPDCGQQQTSVISLPRTSGASQADRDRVGNEVNAMRSALGELWETGLPVDWKSVTPDCRGKRVPLPTYPFQRSKHWIEPARDHCKSECDELRERIPREATRATEDDELHHEVTDLQQTGTPDRSVEDGNSRSIDAVQDPGTESTGTASTLPLETARVATPDSRAVQTLVQILQDLSGRSPIDLRAPGTWLDKGFDSLFLTQFARNIEKNCKIPITFRQLVEDHSTLDSLARFISTHQPPTVPLSDIQRSDLQRLGVVDAVTGEQSSHVQVDEKAVAGLNERLDQMTRQIARLTETIEAMQSANVQQSDSQLTPVSETRNGDHRPVEQDAGLEQDAEKTELITLPVSDGQREIWLASQMEQDASRTFNEAYTIKFEGVLDAGHLSRCLQQIVNRHDALRITFSSDGMLQYVHPKGQHEIEFVDVPSAESPDLSTRQFDELLKQRMRQPFDLQLGPLFRFALFRMSETRHVLLLLAHHVVLDGWSWGVVLQELSTLYRGEATNGVAGLGEAQSYKHHLLWSNSKPQLAKAGVDLQHWQSIFELPYDEFELPTEKQRPAEKTYGSGCVVELVDESLTRQLRAFSRQQNCTLFSFLLAGFNAWLQRITHREDLVVGVPIAGQLANSDPELDDASRLVGHCVNMLPIRSQCQADESFVEFMRRLNETVFEALEHQNFTFGNLLETLSVKRDTSRIPIITASFNLSTAYETDFGAVSAQISRLAKLYNYFDLTLDIIDRGDHLELECKFNDDLYQAEYVRTWLAQYRRLLARVSEKPEIPIAEIPLLDCADEEFILRELNATDAVYDQNATLHGLIRQQARKTPDRVAVQFATEAISYRELDEMSDALAAYLHEHTQVGPDRLVGVCLERSIEMVVALLAVMKSGAAYVPLDPAYPADRISYILRDSSSVCILTDSRLQHVNGTLPTPIVMVDDVLPVLKPKKFQLPIQQESAENLAYVIYTSGSTGKPKGVQIEHSAAVNFLQSMKREPGLTEHDVLLAVTTVSFDIAVLELYLPLMTGATVVIAGRETAMDAVALEQTMKDYSVSVMQATPATYRMLVQAGWAGNESLKLLCGGEPLPIELADALVPRCGELWNMYGPTETTVWSTCCRVADASNIHIGRPIDNTQIYIVDQQFKPTPIGVAGELLIGGHGLARGYLGKPDLTQEKFIDSPFVEGQRLYRTGDLARYRRDGTIDCLGRLDFQVKVRGFRIELGEIEAVLNEMDAVEQAVVIADADGKEEARLVAHVVAENASSTLTAETLRGHLRDKLPEYMVPSVFSFLTIIPTTPNGKVDRKALPKIVSPSTAAMVGRRPVSRTEKTVAKIWQKHLRLKAVDAETSFFDLGGHSLLAVSVFQDISRQLGVQLPLGALIKASTIAALATLIDEKRASDASTGNSLISLSQSKGNKASPLYLVHGAGGDVLLYQKLVKRLAESRSVMGLQSQGVDAATDPLETISDMATCYMKEILAEQPSGPYRIAGYCLGGTIAFELARQLNAAGHQVEMLALLDTYNFSQVKRPGFVSVFSQRCYFHLRNLLRTELKKWPGYFASKLQVIRSGELRLLLRSTLPWLFKSRSKEAAADKPPILDLNQTAAFSYEPEYYPGKVMLITPRTNYSFFPDRQMGWGELAEDVEVIRLDALPHAMLEEPGVEELARTLSS